MYNDAFYTQISIAEQLIKYLSTLYIFEDFDNIIEPSAGNGSFSDYFFENYIDKLIAIDIEPNKKYIIKSDFLNYDISILKDKNNLFIGNPPFSIKLLNAFIKKIAIYANIIALILPISFDNNNRIRLIPKEFHLIKSIILPINAFEDKFNKEYSYNTKFYIFEKKNYNRPLKIVQYPIYYKFVKYNEIFDYFVYRVGNKCSLIETYDKNKKYNPFHYFIKLNSEIDKNKFILFYNKIDFLKSYNNTTTLKSLPKYKLIEKLNEISTDNINKIPKITDDI